MFYVSDVLSITDSETGETFRVACKDKGYYINGRNVYLDKVLGYFPDGSIDVVGKTLISLLDYIESIDLCSSLDTFVRVSNFGINVASDCNILVKLNITGRVCSVLDMILCASYRDDFKKMLEGGSVAVLFGLDDYVRIKFCGDYMGHVAKLVSLCRTDSWVKSKMSQNGYLRGSEVAIHR